VGPRPPSLIDLHTHTTASDGRLTPDALVARAAGAGVATLAVTDHDTTAACAPVADACRVHGIEFVAGIEITAILDGADVHVLGYFVDPASPALQAFLAVQRQVRIERVREMVGRLATFDIALDADAIVAPALADPRRAAGRPWIARALIAAGHVASTTEAFDRWLARGRPAFVPRSGPHPRDVFAEIHAAAGIASLAHPGLVGRDQWIPQFAAAGLDALEAYHSEHDGIATAKYLALARELGLAVSGGSDFHGDPAHGPSHPGSVSLPRAAYIALQERLAASRASASGSNTSS
jgi:hypothetical protein